MPGSVLAQSTPSFAFDLEIFSSTYRRCYAFVPRPGKRVDQVTGFIRVSEYHRRSQGQSNIEQGLTLRSTINRGAIAGMSTSVRSNMHKRDEDIQGILRPGIITI